VDLSSSKGCTRVRSTRLRADQESGRESSSLDSHCSTDNQVRFGGLKSTGALFFTAPNQYVSNAGCFFR
jgi:hypothetical protein